MGRTRKGAWKRGQKTSKERKDWNEENTEMEGKRGGGCREGLDKGKATDESEK